MNFGPEDLDWVLGELLHLIWQARRLRVNAAHLDPILFMRCMNFINSCDVPTRLHIDRILNPRVETLGVVIDAKSRFKARRKNADDSSGRTAPPSESGDGTRGEDR